ncbi:MAG TPA: DUF4331 family protein [Candidatus Polarisedimenticolia bacterium]|nr:DUF4331 family protein [Candidatus Polarisedimenticolia bacterium]
MRTRTKVAAVGAAIAVLTVGVAPLISGAADHLEAPLAKAHHDLDITDIYAFDGANSKNTVLVIDVNPFAGTATNTGTKFSTDGEYRFNVDTDGDYAADDIYTVTFGSNAPDGKQSLTLWKNGSAVVSGKTGNASIGGGAKVYAGLRDDPFFFDLVSFRAWRDPDGDGAFTYTGSTTFAGIDTFRGANVSAIVLEIPDSWLGSSANFWGSTLLGGNVIDRMGKPALATVFVNPFGGDSDKDAYNQTAPEDDVTAWGGLFTAVENVFYGAGSPYPAAITGLLLPDVLHLDVANLGKSTGTGFTGGAGGILNGRTLAEDVIDLELIVVTGGLAGTPVVATDGVGANDVAFPGSFPYLAPAH